MTKDKLEMPFPGQILPPGAKLIPPGPVVYEVAVEVGNEKTVHRADNMQITAGNCLVLNFNGKAVAAYREWDRMVAEEID